MVNVSLERWIKSRLYRLKIASCKLPFVIFVFFIITFWSLYSKLSAIEDLQQKVLKVSYKNFLPETSVKNSACQNKVTPKYWLSAKKPDAEFLKHVRNVFHALGYERWDKASGNWDVMWAYEYPFHSAIEPVNLKSHQLVNHFPGSGYLTSKVHLAMSKFKYIPTAFSLPKEKDKFLKYAAVHNDKLWVQKSNQHRGITIKSVNELDLEASDSFIQEYVDDPFLVDGKKFDIGIYTIVTSIDPLRVYVFKDEWLMRYCAEVYKPFDVHNSKKYVVGDDYTPTWKLPSLRDIYNRLQFSHKDSLQYYLKSNGHDFLKLEAEIYNAVAETILKKKSDIMRAISNYPFGSNSFFEMMRFDFVVDSKLNVYLMEVNMSPNLSSAHFSENGIMYEKVIFNTLSLAGVSYATHNNDNFDKSLVTDRDIQVYAEKCLRCTSCSEEICNLCISCMQDSVREMLKSAYRERLNSFQSFRVFPKTSHIQPTFTDYAGLTQNDRLLHLWYKGMCIKDKAWCV